MTDFVQGFFIGTLSILAVLWVVVFVLPLLKKPYNPIIKKRQEEEER